MTAPAKSWRDVLPVHPAADLFPRMSKAELRELGEDIRKNGLQFPVVVQRDGDEYKLLDGCNRLDAMELVGIGFELEFIRDGRRRARRPVLNIQDYIPFTLDDQEIELEGDHDPYEFVISANTRRRHLTAEQKRELIAKVLRAKPEKSDRQIADTVKASPTTVGKVRAEMESTGDVSKLDTRQDKRGRTQPAKKKAGKLPLPDCPICEGKGGTQLVNITHECGSSAGQAELPCPCMHIKRRGNGKLYEQLRKFRDGMGVEYSEKEVPRAPEDFQREPKVRGNGANGAYDYDAEEVRAMEVAELLILAAPDLAREICNFTSRQWFPFAEKLEEEFRTFAVGEVAAKSIAKGDQRIAELEGQLKEKDSRIAELEQQLNVLCARDFEKRHKGKTAPENGGDGILRF